MGFDFQAFPKIPRLKREVVITEKIDGTNAQVGILEVSSGDIHAAVLTDPFCLRVLPGERDGDSALAFYAGSRSRWLTLEEDNFGFARWVTEHAEELRRLGAGRHYGEWWGLGIQRGYAQVRRRFALFNVNRWGAPALLPACVDVVPVLARGNDLDVEDALERLAVSGSILAPGYLNPEGIVIYHSASGQLYKMTFEQDGGKWRR